MGTRMFQPSVAKDACDKLLEMAVRQRAARFIAALAAEPILPGSRSDGATWVRTFLDAVVAVDWRNAHLKIPLDLSPQGLGLARENYPTLHWPRDEAEMREELSEIGQWINDAAFDMTVKGPSMAQAWFYVAAFLDAKAPCDLSGGAARYHLYAPQMPKLPKVPDLDTILSKRSRTLSDRDFELLGDRLEPFIYAPLRPIPGYLFIRYAPSGRREVWKAKDLRDVKLAEYCAANPLG